MSGIEAKKYFADLWRMSQMVAIVECGRWSAPHPGCDPVHVERPTQLINFECKRL